MDEDYSSLSGTLSQSEAESVQPVSVSLPFVSALPVVDTPIISACDAAATVVGSQVAVVSAVGAGGGGGGEPSVPRKRGRPRKSDSPKVDLRVVHVTPTPFKRGRGRPPGSRNNKNKINSQPLVSPSDLFSMTARDGFMSHLINVPAGEDVISTIISFLQNDSRTMLVMSANGTVSSVSIRQSGTGGILTFEGNFEILSISGSFRVSKKDGVKGGMRVTLAGSNGHIIGGSVDGLLRAATPVQLVLASFLTDVNCSKAKKTKYQKKLKVGIANPTGINDIVDPAAPAPMPMPAPAPMPILDAFVGPYGVTPASPISQSVRFGNNNITNNVFSAATSPNNFMVPNQMDSEVVPAENNIMDNRWNIHMDSTP